MVARDQAARRNWDPSEPEPPDVVSVDQDNLIALKHILIQHEFPTAKMVGYNGVSSAWLLLQHLDRDQELQRVWLPAITSRARTGELSYEVRSFYGSRPIGERKETALWLTNNRGEWEDCLTSS
jgi:hypothetical protein